MTVLEDRWVNSYSDYTLQRCGSPLTVVSTYGGHAVWATTGHSRHGCHVRSLSHGHYIGIHESTRRSGCAETTGLWTTGLGCARTAVTGQAESSETAFLANIPTMRKFPGTVAGLRPDSWRHLRGTRPQRLKINQTTCIVLKTKTIHVFTCL